MEDLLIHELSAAYALDALDAVDVQAFEDHLASCTTCREDVAGFTEIAASLAYATSAKAPPPALRARVLAAARAQRGNLVPFRRRRPVVAVAAAAAAACLAAIGTWALTARPSGEALRTLPLHSAAGSVVVSKDGEAALVVSGLSRPPHGKTYEAWVMHGGSATPAGTFSAPRGATSFRLTRRVPDGSFVGVTLEPAGGSRRPTGRPLFVSAPA